MSKNNLPPRGSVEVQKKPELSYITENQKIPGSNLKSPEIGGAALAGTDGRVTNCDEYPDYRNKFNKYSPVEDILGIGKLIKELRNDKVNAGL